jgi:group I intron endonuclease
MPPIYADITIQPEVDGTITISLIPPTSVLIPITRIGTIEYKNLRKPGIYIVYNFISNKGYVGSSKSVVDRCRGHYLQLEKGKHENIKLQNSWNKHGKSSFEFWVLEFCTEENLIVAEDKWILKLDSYHNGYNCNEIAGSPPHTVEMARAASERMKLLHKQGKLNTPEQNMRSAQRIRELTRLGIMATPEQRKRASERIAKQNSELPKTERQRRAAGEHLRKFVRKHIEEYRQRGASQLKQMHENGEMEWTQEKKDKMIKTLLEGYASGRIKPSIPNEETKRKMAAGRRKYAREHKQELSERMSRIHHLAVKSRLEKRRDLSKEKEIVQILSNQGFSHLKIADQLNKNGYPTVTGKGKWYGPTVKRFLAQIKRGAV